MAKITLSNVSSGYNRQNINTNFEDIETDLQEKVLYRDNPDGEANQMENELDMNSNDIANAKDIYTSKLYLNGERVVALYTTEAPDDAASITYDNTDSSLVATDVQDAIDEIEGRTDTAEDRLDINELAITAIEGKLAKETVFAITDGASVDLDPANGGIQTWTLGADRTATDSFSSGQSMTFIITASGYELTWPTMLWVGGSAPVLANGESIVELFKVGSTLYGAVVGDPS